MPIEAGELAPFSGQLLHTELAVKLSQKAARADSVENLEIEKLQALHRIDLAEALASHNIVLGAATGKLEIATDQLDRAYSWTRSPGLWFALGTVSAVAIIYTAAAVVR